MQTNSPIDVRGQRPVTACAPGSQHGRGDAQTGESSAAPLGAALGAKQAHIKALLAHIGVIWAQPRTKAVIKIYTAPRRRALLVGY